MENAGALETQYIETIVSTFNCPFLSFKGSFYHLNISGILVPHKPFVEVVDNHMVTMGSYVHALVWCSLLGFILFLR